MKPAQNAPLHKTEKARNHRGRTDFGTYRARFEDACACATDLVRGTYTLSLRMAADRPKTDAVVGSQSNAQRRPGL